MHLLQWQIRSLVGSCPYLLENSLTKSVKVEDIADYRTLPLDRTSRFLSISFSFTS